MKYASIDEIEQYDIRECLFKEKQKYMFFPPHNKSAFYIYGS